MMLLSSSLLILISVLTVLPRPVEAVSVTAYTGYENKLTAKGKFKANKTCAVSRDLRHLIGERIYIEGVGTYFVNDLMRKDIRRTVDVAVKTKRQAKFFGRKLDKKIKKL